MATIDNLIDKISNPELRSKLLQELSRLQQEKQFGLVFEEHLPDATLLYEVEVRRGQKVTLKDKPLKEKFEVVNLCNGVAECVSLDEPEHTMDIAVDELVSYSELNVKSLNHIAVDKLIPFADFGDPIYPYLQPIDKISTAPDSPLWHEIIEADNYHALQLLAYLYPGKVDCIYIDPPYNTGARDWKYNNNYVDSTDAYRHSKWLSMMKKRLLIAKKLLNPADSVLIVTIDEKEYVHLGALLEDIFPEALIQMVSSQITPQGNPRAQQFYRTSEMIYFVQLGTSSALSLPLNEHWRTGTGENQNKKINWVSLLRTGSERKRSDRPPMFYPIFITKTDLGPIIHSIGEPYYGEDLDIQTPENTTVVWPIGRDGELRRWQVSCDTFKELLAKGFLRLGKWNGQKTAVKYLAESNRKDIEDDLIPIIGRRYDNSVVLDEHFVPKFIPGTIWKIPSHDATRFGSQLLSKIFPNKVFDYPKSLYAVHDTLRFFVANKPNALIVDFFAGSGTTLHAVNLLNKEDGGNRRCIMVTNNEVSEEEEQRLKDKGLTPADEEWKALGIARYVTWPRTVASISGNSINGDPINGEYLTYLREEKETSRKFIKISFVKDFSMLSLEERKDLVSQLSGKKIAKNKVNEDTRYLIDEDSEIAILLDDSSTDDWLDELESADQIKTFYIVTQNNKLFNSLKKHISEFLGSYKETVPLTFPMTEGFKANVEFFHLGFLDKRAVERNRQFREILPLLWLKAGGIGECPKIIGDSLQPYLVLQENKFAVLINEDAFFAFEKEVNSTAGIETAYIITDSEKGYKEMVAALKVKTCYQLYRDYLDNFKINYTR